MPKGYDLYALSRARRQAKSALTRGRRAKKVSTSGPAETPGQLSIEDVLADIAAEQAAEQAAVGAALRESVDVAAARRGGAA